MSRHEPETPNSKEPEERTGKNEEQAKVKDGALKALAGSDRFTTEEQEAIASTIEAEVAKLLPDLPKGIAEIAFKAVVLSLDAADKLVGKPDPSPSDE